jgi:hypothetical protein
MHSQKYYREKYLKYKIKYLELKNNFNMEMIGGDLPYITKIDKINLFKPTIQSHKDMEPYLNPIYGLIMHKSGYIKNKFFLSKAQKNTKSVSVQSESSEPSAPSESSKSSKPSEPSKLNEYYKYYRLLKEIPGQIQPNNENMEVKPIDIGRYIALLYISKDYQNLSKMETRKIIYNICNNKFDANKIQKFFTNTLKLIKECFPIVKTTNIDDFHIILFCLWWVLNNDEGIKDYYTGINEIFEICNKYFTDKQYDLINLEYYDPNPNSFEQIIFEITKEDFKIYKQEQAKHFCPNLKDETYPDCGEVTARNLINLICYNFQTKKFDIDILNNYGGIGKLINYYTVFNNFTDQSSIKPVDIYDVELNPRDAWSKLIISDEKAKHNLRLSNSCISRTQSFNNYNYELDSGMSLDVTNTNFFQLICNLLPKVTKWDDLLKSDDTIKPTKIIKIENNIDSKGIGTIVIHHEELKKFIIYCEAHHFYMKHIKEKEEEVDYTGFTGDKHDKISILLKKKEKINKDNYFWIDWSSELLVGMINKDTTEIELKKKLLELSFTDQYDSDTRKRIKIDVDNNDFFNYFINNFRLNKKINEYTYKSNNFEFVKQLENLRHLNSIIKDKSIISIDLSPLSNITSIGDEFLWICLRLESIDLSPLINLTSISDDFLNGCDGLESINLSPLINLTSIGDNFLNGCIGLKSINLTDLTKVVSIGDDFLYMCKQLESIDLSYLINLKEIRSGFLRDCIKLKSINLKNLTKVVSIGDKFLYSCMQLESIDLSPLINLTSIGNDSFSRCTSLNNVIYTIKQNTLLTSIQRIQRIRPIRLQIIP